MPKASFPLWVVGLSAVGAQVFLSESRMPWTLWPGLALAGFTLFAWKPAPRSAAFRMTPLQELLAFAAILLAAFFLRAYRLGEIPPGLPADQGSLGLTALQILEGWRPFYEAYALLVPEPLTPYLLAAWFHLTGQEGLLGLRSFFVLFSLASSLFIYWYFRQVAGPRTALLTLLFLALLRWDFVMVRNSQPSVAVPFFLFATLSFLLYGLRAGRAWALWTSVLFAGAGLYSYQACKVIPLLAVVLVVFESRRSRKNWIHPRHWIALGLGFLLLASPLLVQGAKEGFLRKREAGEFIAKRMVAEKSLAPLLHSWSGTALMAHRAGDPSPWYNLKGQRMLDDATGILLILGMAWAWRSRKTPEGFHALLGSLVLLLPALLSHVPAASHRLTGLLPFLAFLSAKALDSLPFPGKRMRLVGTTGLFLLVATQNLWTYFGLQAKDPAYQEASGPVATAISLTVASLEKNRPGLYRYWIDPDVAEHPTLLFLTRPWRERMGKLDLGDWTGVKRPVGDSVFFLHRAKKGAPGFLAGLFPGSSLDLLTDPQGRPLATMVQVSKESRAQEWTRGLRGDYFTAGSAGQGPSARRTDPLVDFASFRDFPFQALPFQARWTGSLEVQRAGSYRFQVLCSDQAQLRLDGKPVVPDLPLSLAQGRHELRLEFMKKEGAYAALHLLWKKPGEEAWEVVPARAFGKPPK